MTDLLEQGVDWLTHQRHAHMTRTITYQRDVASCELAATIGDSEFEQVDDHNIVHKLESRDFLIRTADLILGGSQTLPQAGDRVRETVESQVFVYEVMGPGGEPPYRYSDQYRKTLRIHTKHIDTEVA